MTRSIEERKAQAHTCKLAKRLNAIGYDNDFNDLADFFQGCASFHTRETAAGEYESEFVYLAFGGPYITFDTANGKILGAYGTVAYVRGVALDNINKFFRTLHDC